MEKQQKHVKPQDLEERLIEFASRIIDMAEALPQSATAKHLGGQILRSGTSPALNYGEAQAAEPASKPPSPFKISVGLTKNFKNRQSNTSKIFNHVID